MSLKVCLDIRAAQTGAKHTGTGVYTTELVRALQCVKHDFEIWYLVLSNYPLPELNLPSNRLVKVWRPPKPERWHVVFDWLGLGRLLTAKKFDLFHSLVPGVVQPIDRLRVVVTIHDLIPLLFPKDYSKSLDEMLLYRLRLRSICKANHLIADSNNTRDDLIEHCRVATDRVSVAYLSVNSMFTPAHPSIINEFRKQYSLPEHYILYLGGYSFRKNNARLIQAYHQLGDLRRTAKLVLAGNIHPKFKQQLQQQIDRLGMKNDVIWFGHVSQVNLPILYSAAEVFAYPSLYEGFGLPVLEAMACGVPVVTTNAGSLAEVAGDAALKVNPVDIDEISNALINIVSDEKLRGNLINKGKQQILKFSWKETAIKTLDVYNQVM